MPKIFEDDIVEELLEKLEGGESLLSACKDKRMPSKHTVRQWAKDDPVFSSRLLRAREDGYHYRAEKAVEAAQTATDAAKGRLAFDAERWHLGKLSNAFADKLKHVGGDEGDSPIRVKNETPLEELPSDEVKAMLQDAGLASLIGDSSD